MVIPAPTIIDIAPSVDVTLCDEENPYFQRIEPTVKIWSSTKFDHVSLFHLGFPAYRVGKRFIKLRGDRYSVIIALNPNGGAQFDSAPFGVHLDNMGDGFIRVSVRMRNGIERCKMTLLQEQYQPKAPKDIDAFIKIEDIWYATAIMNCLQTIRIEEREEA